MKHFKVLFVILVLIFCTAIPAFAEDAISVSEMKNPAGTLLCIAHGGVHTEYEANSEEAIDKAIELGVDIISVDIKKALGGLTALDNSKETDLEFFLLDYNSRAVIMINNAERYKKELYKILESTDSFESVILRMECEYSEISEWYESLEKKPMIICRYTGNIIFNVLSEASDNFDSGLPVVEYATKNMNGVIFNALTQNSYVYNNYFSKGRKFISTVDKELCGSRQDTVQYWDELCSLGFNMIETDNPETFIQYRETAKILYSELKTTYESAKEADVSKCNNASLKNYNNAMSEARELLGKGIYSVDALDLAIQELDDAVENLVPSYGNAEGKLNLNGPRLFLGICTVLVFVAVQIYILKKRKKAN